MAQRFCNRCGSDVEDTGGFCLLGHRLAVAAPDEVRDLAAAPPPPPPVAPVEAEAAVPAVSSVAPTWAALDTTPGAPPVPDDPINQFAPPARMDWGPGSSVKRFSLKRLRAEVSV
jgi:hypothetical protein